MRLMVVMKVKPVESCRNGAESLECTNGITTKPFATRNKEQVPIAKRNKPTPDSRLVASQQPDVEREEAPKPSFHELNTPHRSPIKPIFLLELFNCTVGT